MNSQLFTHYSFDECTDEEKLFTKLDLLAQEGKIQYNSENQYIFKIKDIDLTDNEIVELCSLFDTLEVYPYLESDESNDFDDFDDFDDFEDEDDDYTTKRYRSKDDDFDDY